MGLADDSSLRRHVTTAAAELGRSVSRSEIEQAVIGGFDRILKSQCARAELSREERQREATLIPDYSIQTTRRVDP
jgi:hypothetical protein